MSDEYSQKVKDIAAQLSKLTAEEQEITSGLGMFFREQGLIERDYNNPDVLSKYVGDVLSEFIRLCDEHKAKA